jgi:NADH-quinone oxidoreductase subunit G
MRQRLDRPYVRERKALKPATWPEAFQAVAAKVAKASPDRIGVIAGDLQDAESMKAALDLFSGLGVKSLDCRQDGAALGGGAREGWLFNSTIAGIEQADLVLLVGTNPRLEAPLVNTRIRKRWYSGKLKVGVIGERADLTYPYDYLGAGPGTLAELAEGKGAFAETLKGAANAMIVVGQGALTRKDGAAVLAAAAKLGAAFSFVREGWNGFNVLHTAASRVAGLDLGFIPGKGGLAAADMVGKGALDVLFLLGADEIDVSQTDAFVVYLGSHGDRGAHRADVILPGAAYTEKPGLYVNTEGRVQMANRVVFPKGEAREDWAILRALSERLGKTLPYDSLDQLRARLFADHPTFGQIDYAPGAATASGFDLAKLGKAGKLTDAPFASPVADFYLTNPIARASVTMAECSAVAAEARGGLQAAE